MTSYALYVTTMETITHEMLQQIRPAIGSPFRRRSTPCSKTSTARTVAGTDMKRLAIRKIYETPEKMVLDCEVSDIIVHDKTQ